MLEPWNPFDTNNDRECFPGLQEALHSTHAPAVVDIDQQRSSWGEAGPDVEGWQQVQQQPETARGFLAPETSQRLEAKCQAWFDALAALKAERVGAWARRHAAGLGFQLHATDVAPQQTSPRADSNTTLCDGLLYPPVG